MKSAQKRGFTLVELLVVISIIAILATVSLTLYNGVQKKARIAKRIEDLKAIQTALEIYYSVNKTYPTTNGNWRSECNTWSSGCSTVPCPNNEVIPGLVPTYMPVLPADPQMNNSASTACYIYKSDGVDYKVLVYSVSEFTQADIDSQRNLYDPVRDGGNGTCPTVDTNHSWTIYSSNTSLCW